MLSSNVKILASNTDIFSDTNIEIKSKKSEGRSLVISVNSKKFLFVFLFMKKSNLFVIFVLSKKFSIWNLISLGDWSNQ